MIDPLLRELTGEASWQREQALARLKEEAPTPELLDELAAALADQEHADRRNAARSALAALAAPDAAAADQAVRYVAGLLDPGNDSDLRVLAAATLGDSGNPLAREPLEGALSDAEENVAATAADALGLLGDPRAADALAGAIERGSAWTRITAVVAIGRLRTERALPVLRRIAADPELAELAADALGQIRTPAALDSLREAVAAGAGITGLKAVARIVAAHPEIDPPDWSREAAREHEERLRARLEEDGDVMAARVLGLAGTSAAAAALADAVGRAGLEDAAAAGISHLPPESAARVVERLPEIAPGTRAMVLASLPPLQDADAASGVARYLSDSDESVRGAAAEALGRSDPQLVLPLLERALRDPRARLGAARAYARLGDIRCEPLESLLDDADAGVRGAAAEALARCGRTSADRLVEALGAEDDPGVRQAITRALGVIGGSSAVRELARLARSDDLATRFVAVDALGRTGEPDAFSPLLDSLLDPHPEVQAAALNALGRLGDPRAGSPLADHLNDADTDLRRAAAFALDRIAPPGVTERLSRALDDPDREVRLTAARVLGRVGDPSIAPRLEEIATRDHDPLVRRAACDAAEDLRAREAR